MRSFLTILFFERQRGTAALDRYAVTLFGERGKFVCFRKKKIGIEKDDRYVKP